MPGAAEAPRAAATQRLGRRLLPRHRARPRHARGGRAEPRAPRVARRARIARDAGVFRPLGSPSLLGLGRTGGGQPAFPTSLVLILKFKNMEALLLEFLQSILLEKPFPKATHSIQRASNCFVVFWVPGSVSSLFVLCHKIP